MKKSVAYCLFVRFPFWLILTSVAIAIPFRWIPVRYTLTMLKREIQFRHDRNYLRKQKYVRIEDMPRELIHAVTIAEDQKFYNHHGFDWKELRAMWIEHRQNGTPLRGCSTISQQTAKNVFTLSSHTVIRKLWEAYWTVIIETLWSKERILEYYVNNAEMGPGIFGIGAASMVYYDKEASQLNLDEILTIVACLPSPLTEQPGNLSTKALNRKRTLARRMLIAKD